MRQLLAIGAIALGLAGVPGCSQPEAALEIQPGSDVTLEKKDGVKLTGRLVEVKPEHVTIEGAAGARTSVARTDIAAVRSTLTRTSARPAADANVGSSGSPADPRSTDASRTGDRRNEPSPAHREVTIPAGTILPVDLQTSVSSDSSRLEDPVRGTLRRAITVGGVQALPAGTTVLGHVTAAERSARVKGRAFVAFRFTALDPPGDAERVPMRTDAITKLAAHTKKADAAKIGGGAVGGAIIGGILGGGDGAAKGAALGGAAGTGVVLSTRGKEVRLRPGADVSVRLAAPITLRVPER